MDTEKHKNYSIKIARQKSETPLIDVMGGDSRWTIKLHEHGFISLVDCMPRLVPASAEDTTSIIPTADSAIVQAARVSYGEGTKKINEDRALIRYLLRHRHTTPFEMIEFKFHVAMPIFVARQWIRHRTANVNEYSGRYSVMPDRFYKPSPDNIRLQSTSNKQGGDTAIINENTAQEFLDYLDKAEALYNEYQNLTDKGIARELARLGLPVSVYTEWYWKCDLHNIMHFLSLRMDEHAQAEIRDYAYAMYSLIEPICPITMEAFRDYRLEAMHLTRLEIAALKSDQPLKTRNQREQSEWEAKMRCLGLGIKKLL